MTGGQQAPPQASKQSRKLDLKMTTTSALQLTAGYAFRAPAHSAAAWPLRGEEDFRPAASSLVEERLPMNLSGRATVGEAIIETLLSVAGGAAVAYGLYAALSFASALP